MRDKLTARQVQNLKKRGRFADGGGLYLQICRPGYKQWTFRFMLAGTRREMALGPVSDVTLAEARQKAIEARKLTREGRDPIEVRDQAQAALKVASLKAISFKEAALDFLQTAKIDSFKNAVHRKQWRSTLERVFPVIGDLPLQSIDSGIVLQALMPIWKQTPETGSRLRGRIERVFEWARPLGLFEGQNPASREILQDHLPVKAKPKHHAALPYADLPAFMVELGQRDSVSARCLEFTILTAVRTSEAIGATWNEIDMDAGVWTIPASRMKAKRDHRVPLSDRAVEILRDISGKHDKSGHVFINGGGLPLSNQAMSELLKGMVPPKRAVVHGFRSSFSDWARDRTNYPRDVIEMALAHTIKDKSEAAYRRGDALDKRRKLMDAWSSYCAAPAVTGENIVAIRG
jgi:integrase